MRLKLNATWIGDDGLMQLRSLMSLRELEVHQTNVTSRGIEGLKQALPRATIDTRRNY